jgi:hypothetical protein
MDNFVITNNNHNTSYDEEVYDDRVFYSMLLKVSYMNIVYIIIITIN